LHRIELYCRIEALVRKPYQLSSTDSTHEQTDACSIVLVSRPPIFVEGTVNTERDIQWWVTRALRLGVDDLETITRSYWDRTKPSPDATVSQRMAWYIQNLLPEELYHASERRRALRSHPCRTLVLLVGHSPEPLLQAISVFQPQRVVLALNQSYGEQNGEQRGGEMKEWIERWLTPMLPHCPAVDLFVVADQPDTVFRALCENILPDRQQGHPIIVDITGAKKSIVAGAFLFAAYADIPISYVDFDDYDEKYRRPFGFNCRIGTLANPYDAFRLREWEQVQRMYEGYRFRAATDTLAGILDLMGKMVQTSQEIGPTLYPFQSEHVQSTQTLLDVLEFYIAWDDGNYSRAKQLLDGLQQRLPAFLPPLAVTLLGDVWPHPGNRNGAEDAAHQLLALHDQLRTCSPSLFESNTLLITYAHDELAKIQRLVDANEDNRSALLRAAGLDELLLKARLVRLWHTGAEGWIGLWEYDESCVGRCRTVEGDLQQKLYEALLEHQGTDHMRRALQRRPYYDRKLKRNVPGFVKLDVWWASYRARPVGEAPCLGNYDQHTGLSGETLTQLRNQAIHMYLCITQPVAQAAVNLARANVDEFEANWALLCGQSPKITEEDIEQLAWGQLCLLCELDFLPLSSSVRS
jgi:hypothetical protein